MIKNMYLNIQMFNYSYINDLMKYPDTYTYLK